MLIYAGFLKVLKTMCINVKKSLLHPSISTLRPVISSNIPVENNYKTFQNFFSIETQPVFNLVPFQLFKKVCLKGAMKFHHENDLSFDCIFWQ